jgi:hypothetical protein
MSRWVDFRDIKTQVTFSMVLRHYELLDDAETSRQGEIAIRCPFHDTTTRTLKANDTKRGFHCFATECGKKGNVIDFTAFMEELSFRNAALFLHELFLKPADGTPPSPAPRGPEEAATAPPPPAKGRGYMREVESKLRELLGAEDQEGLITWVKDELLASYRRGVEKGKANSATVTS